MIAQIWADGGALTGLVNNAAGNFISRTKDLTPKGFNAISDIVFRGSFYVTLACGKRWIDGEAQSQRDLDPHDMDLERRSVHRAVRDVESRRQHHDQVARDRMGSERHPPQRHRAGPVPDQGRVGTAQSRRPASRGDSSNAIPMGRNGEMVELANLAVFLMADGCDYLTGQTIAIDGAMHLGGSGNFSALMRLGDAEWEAIGQEIRAANDKDKAKRTA